VSDPEEPAAFDLSGRVAAITGASAGIGAATARRLARRGMSLVLGARRVDRLEALAAQLGETCGVAVHARALDVTQPASVAAWCEAAQRFAGRQGIHALVNCAGLAAGVARLPTAGPDEEAGWQRTFDVNVMGLLRTTRALLADMVARGRGHVVNLGSMAGIDTYEGGAVYCASKAAVRVVSKALRLELFGSGVRVCCINPGLVKTEFSRVRLGDDAQAEAVYAGMTPLTGDEVARSIEWVLALPEFMNIEEVDLMPTDQASVHKVFRRARGSA
jgi:hypothetical protein